ncbi:Methylsterol monooxygenase 1 [Hondaea fermentalgiana]|uniref:Methylsterol monooxygenase 1 n=1 Tax=Hondaea fermentalgiana TaxID=2315210 RepID=A0A2R5GJS1_9STRA|nr:Methylsterol monooxygenase 1 [Hondaea fermentalgiana]|eukprot:GBG30569.1 Methylsterol monooxygenase 1 [Hondaea fermentalgiana]
MAQQQLEQQVHAQGEQQQQQGGQVQAHGKKKTPSGVCDNRGLLQRYKMQAGKAQAPTSKLVYKTLLEAFFGQFVLSPFTSMALFKAARKLGMPDLIAPLPGFAGLFKAFAIAHFFNNFFFYWAHRLVHSKALYSKIHKQHHNYIETIGIAAEYASPAEQVAANYMPTLGGVLLFGRNPLIFFVWLVYRLEETYEAHSGYYFANTWLGKIGLTNAEHSAFHFSHHLQNRGNFGSWHMDYLFGTMDAWIAAGDTEGYVAEHLLSSSPKEI